MTENPLDRVKLGILHTLNKMAADNGKDYLEGMTGEKIMATSDLFALIGQATGKPQGLIDKYAKVFDENREVLVAYTNQVLDDITLRSDKGCWELTMTGLLHTISTVIGTNGWDYTNLVHYEFDPEKLAVRLVDAGTVRRTDSESKRRMVAFLKRPETKARIAEYLTKEREFFREQFQRTPAPVAVEV